MPPFPKKTPFHDRRDEDTAGRFGMALFLASLAMLFLATVIGFAVIRWINDDWPRDLPALPRVLWLSTALLVVSSATIEGARRAVRAGAVRRAGRLMAATTALGAAFLLLQAVAWFQWRSALAGRLADEGPRFALASFYVLTGVHAAHVVGGLVPMAITTARARAGAYDAAHHGGITHCAYYWHFLDVVWLVLFATLLIGG